LRLDAYGDEALIGHHPPADSPRHLDDVSLTIAALKPHKRRLEEARLRHARECPAVQTTNDRRGDAAMSPNTRGGDKPRTTRAPLQGSANPLLLSRARTGVGRQGRHARKGRRAVVCAPARSPPPVD